MTRYGAAGFDYRSGPSSTGSDVEAMQVTASKLVQAAHTALMCGARSNDDSGNYSTTSWAPSHLH
jgi:hypothetical protein